MSDLYDSAACLTCAERQPAVVVVGPCQLRELAEPRGAVERDQTQRFDEVGVHEIAGARTPLANINFARIERGEKPLQLRRGKKPNAGVLRLRQIGDRIARIVERTLRQPAV